MNCQFYYFFLFFYIKLYFLGGQVGIFAQSLAVDTFQPFFKVGICSKKVGIGGHLGKRNLIHIGIGYLEKLAVGIKICAKINDYASDSPVPDRNLFPSLLVFFDDLIPCRPR